MIEIEFQRLWVLFLAPLLAFPLGYWVWKRRGRGVAVPFDHSSAPRGRGLATMVNLAQSLPALLLAVAVLLWAGPLQRSEPKLKRALTNIEFCVDISYSMTAEFGGGSRYDGSMAAIDEFLDYRQGDSFGLTFFGNTVLHWTPLTSDVSAIRCSPPFMRPENAPSWFGGTEIGKALLASREVLVSREEGDRMIVLISDGFSFDISNGRDEEIARQMIADNIVVYAVHVAESEVPGEIVNIAVLTGGEVFEPGDREALSAVFKRIDEMQQTRLEKHVSEAMDHFRPFAIAGLIFLGLLSTAQFGLRYTPW